MRQSKSLPFEASSHDDHGVDQLPSLNLRDYALIGQVEVRLLRVPMVEFGRAMPKSVA